MEVGELRREHKLALGALGALAVAAAARYADIFILRSPGEPGSIILSKLAGTLALVGYVAASGIGWSTVGFTTRGIWRHTLLGLLLTALYMLLFEALAPAAEAWATGGSWELSFRAGFNPLSREEWLITAMLVLNMPCEEGLFRGALQTSLAECIGRVKANLAQALLFGLWHLVWPAYYGHGLLSWYAAHYVAYTAYFGLVAGFVYDQTRSLTAPIILHFLAGDNALNIRVVDAVVKAGGLQVAVIEGAAALAYAAAAIALSRQLDSSQLA
ncbi:MAG: hypothetical protein DRN99_05390 [Thermoproteota archaeon]|nr:MAG: hypothetical protein DRN99_05390 [Candidatus Korarchaeota archaeon]